MAETGIAFDSLSFVSPDRGFAVAANGRLLNTQDAGRQWRLMRAPSLTGAIVDFVDASHGWVLAGILYRTSDAGKTWTRLAFTCGINRRIARISFVGKRTGFLLCNDENGPFGVYLYRSDDGGTTWHRVSTVDSMAHSLGAFDFISSQIGFVSAGFGNLLRTDDGGHSFRTVPNTPFEDVMASSWHGGRTGFVSTRTVLMRTDDAGAHWTQVYPALRPQGVISLTASGAGIGAGIDWFPAAILRTNNGVDWRKAGQLPASWVQSLVRVSPTRVWIVAPIQHSPIPLERLYRSTDGGRSWQQMFQMPAGGGFLSFVNARLGFFATTDPFRLYRTQDGGETWPRQQDSTQTWNDQFVSAQGGWAWGSQSRLLHTTDGGKDWEGIPIEVAGLHPADLYFVNRNDGWISGTDCNSIPCASVVLLTRDGGAHWTLIRFNRPFASDGFDWVTPNVGYVMYEGALYRTADGSVTWSVTRP